MNLPILYSFLGFTAFAFMDVINKFLFAEVNVPFFSYVILLDISIITCIVVFCIFIKKPLSSLPKTVNYKAVTARSVLSVLNTFCSLLAISYLPLHMFYSLAFMQPIIATVLALLFLIEKPNINKIIIIVIGFLGLLIAINFFSNDSFSIAPLGLIGGLGIALTGALSGIVVKKYMSADSVLTIGFYNIILSILVSSIYLIIKNETLFIPNNIYHLMLIFVAGLLAAFGMIFFMLSYQNGVIQNIVPLQYTQMIWGIVLGYIVFSAIPTFISIVGIIIIMGANLANLEIKKGYFK